MAAMTEIPVLDRNAVARERLRRSIKGYRPMRPKRFRACLSELNLTQQSASLFLGVDERTIRRWASEEKPVPRMVATLLEVLVQRGISVGDALRAIGT